MTPFLKLNEPGGEAVTRVKAALEDAALRIMVSFDSSLTRKADTPLFCPHHGTNTCDCQVVILLVYGHDSQPATLLAHGQDGETWISLVNTPGQRAGKCLQDRIREALAPFPAV
jgi:hypothetical protein